MEDEIRAVEAEIAGRAFEEEARQTAQKLAAQKESQRQGTLQFETARKLLAPYREEVFAGYNILRELVQTRKLYRELEWKHESFWNKAGWYGCKGLAEPIIHLELIAREVNGVKNRHVLAVEGNPPVLARGLPGDIKDIYPKGFYLGNCYTRLIWNQREVAGSGEWPGTVSSSILLWYNFSGKETRIIVSNMWERDKNDFKGFPRVSPVELRRAVIRSYVAENSKLIAHI